jgi:hypothetical protein
MTAQLRVLLVEDSPSDAKLVMLELKRGHHDAYFERVETEAGLRASLAERSFCGGVARRRTSPSIDSPAPNVSATPRASSND